MRIDRPASPTRLAARSETEIGHEHGDDVVSLAIDVRNSRLGHAARRGRELRSTIPAAPSTR
jgi:hypothetical protein